MARKSSHSRRMAELPMYCAMGSGWPGARRADRGVLLGTHHDAWTFGGVDPGTGHGGAPRARARSLGALRRSGWQPQRTISLAFWDAEEFGLIGSTEYAEQWRRAAARRHHVLHQHRSVHERPARRRRRSIAPGSARRCDQRRSRRRRRVSTTRGALTSGRDRPRSGGGAVRTASRSN